MEPEHTSEKDTHSPSASARITLTRAVTLGEYKPEYLSRFPEWQLLSPHAQLQLIREGIRHHKSQLMTQYAALFNTLNFSTKKDELEPRLNRILELVRQTDQDEEFYLAHYVT